MIKNYYKKKALRKLLVEDEKIICNCGKVVDFKDVTFIHFLDMNSFKMWYHHIISFDKDSSSFESKVVKGDSRFWWIGKIPILNDFVYYLYEFFHKPDYYVIVACKKCDEDDDN